MGVERFFLRIVTGSRERPILLVCSVLWILDEALAPSLADDWIMYWVSGVHFAFFVVVTTVLSRLRRAHEHAQQEAFTDRLTALPNGRAFTAACEREIANSKRSGLPFTVALIDCDSVRAGSLGVGGTCLGFGELVNKNTVLPISHAKPVVGGGFPSVSFFGGCLHC
jgi:hypothetical protein